MIDAPRYMCPRGPKTNPRYYWVPGKAMQRDGWKLTRLSDDFDQAATEARDLNRRYGENRTAPNNAHRTLAQLLNDWQASPHFAKLKPNTQRYYKTGTKKLAKWQGRQLAAVTRAGVADIYHQLAATGHGSAAQSVRTGQAAWVWGQGQGLVSQTQPSPWEKQGLEGRRKCGRLWQPAEIDLMVAVASDENYSLGTALLIMEWTGMNPADAVRLSQANYKDGIFTLRRGKTGEPIACEASPRLVERLAQQKKHNQQAGRLATTLLVAEHTGIPWKLDNFRSRFRKARDTAGLTHLVMGHLRHTAVTRLYEAGANEMAIAGVCGLTRRTVGNILDTYNIRTITQTRSGTDLRTRADLRHQN